LRPVSGRKVDDREAVVGDVLEEIFTTPGARVAQDDGGSSEQRDEELFEGDIEVEGGELQDDIGGVEAELALGGEEVVGGNSVREADAFGDAGRA
jgi:hypothetical protein